MVHLLWIFMVHLFSLSNGTSESFSLSIYIAKKNTVEGPHHVTITIPFKIAEENHCNP